MSSNTLFDIAILLKNLIKVSGQIIHGVWKIKKLQQPIITIFGSSLIKQDATFAKKAHIFGHTLIERNISVLTGGGAGIMQAVTCGAIPHDKHIKAKTLSITVKGLVTEEPINPCAHDYLIMDYFFARKWLMINYSVAFVVFPGGFGTLDEFAEVMTLLQTKQLPGKPIILIEYTYWKPLLDWVTLAVNQGTIQQTARDMIYVTDDFDDALNVILKNCQECMKLGILERKGNL